MMNDNIKRADPPGEWGDFQQNNVWIDSSGVQEDVHSGLDLLIMYAKPH
jgi:hypothetical protein